MKDSFRQSMAWLHTWCGLACGWLLCAIFLTGSLSVFRDPITRWMEAQPLATVAQGERLDAGRAVDHAARYLGEHAAGARFWRVQLPQHPGEAMTLTWRLGAGTRHVALSADNGAPLTQGLARKTEGGRHFMSFHYMLHLPVLGFWLVGGLTLGLLVALISGVVVHRRIFLDFFTFRPGRGPRSWLDAHNATAVMTLPFLLMIAYTGLSIFYTSYMPGPLRAVYGAEPDAYSRFQSDLSSPAQLPLSPLGPEGQTVTSQWSELMQRAQVLLGQPARLLLIDRPGAPGMSVRVLGQADTARPSQALFTPQASVLFDGVSGAVLQVQLPEAATLAVGERIYGVIKSLHFADFGGWSMKWLYFISGLLGMLMMAAGTLLFTIKRRIKSQREFGAATAGVYRVVNALNVACVAGMGVACIAYFYANRLLPIEMPGRALWEIRSFLLVWLATLVHALVRPSHKAWSEQLSCAALLCFGLPLLNLLTTGQHIGRYIAADDWQRASVEGVALTFGVLLVVALRKLHRKPDSAAERGRRSAKPTQVN